MRYLGGKSKILKYIEELEILNKKNLVICDLFAGTGIIGDYFKENNIIIANDTQMYSYHLNNAKLSFKSTPKFEKFEEKYGIEIFKYLNEIKNIENEKYFIRDNYSPLGNRMYFTEKNAEKIDLIRVEIENLKILEIISDKEYSFLLASLVESSTKFSNITGTYEAYLKHWDSRAIKEFEIKPIEMNNTLQISDKNQIYNKDSNVLINEIEGDILYLDPPYTGTEYASAYHLLETITKYDIPEIKGITGRRQNRTMSKYTRKNEALNSLESVIKNAKFSHIILSYSTQGIIPIDDLEKMLKKYSKNNKLDRIEIDYREYKNIRKSKKGKLFELLYIIEKDNEVLKSPLNYSGSKNDLFSELNKYFPPNISTFIDSFGGAFNVGINVKAEKVIYNEFNPFTYDIVKILIDTKDKKKLIKNIECIIEENQLSASNKENYIKFRKYYNLKDKSTINLFILSMFCFQNQMRFNSRHEFNTPVGNCAYNSTTKERIQKFIPKTKNYELINKDFYEINYTKYDKDSLFYFDPPYLITNASYNDGKRGFYGWNSELEIKLLDKLLELDRKNYKFALSNVISHKGNTNNLLLNWCEEHKFKVIELEHSRRKEVLIVNYDLTKGVR